MFSQVPYDSWAVPQGRSGMTVTSSERMRPPTQAELRRGMPKYGLRSSEAATELLLRQSQLRNGASTAQGEMGVTSGFAPPSRASALSFLSQRTSRYAQTYVMGQARPYGRRYMPRGLGYLRGGRPGIYSAHDLAQLQSRIRQLESESANKAQFIAESLPRAAAGVYADAPPAPKPGNVEIVPDEYPDPLAAEPETRVQRTAQGLAPEVQFDDMNDIMDRINNMNINAGVGVPDAPIEDAPGSTAKERDDADAQAAAEEAARPAEPTPMDTANAQPPPDPFAPDDPPPTDAVAPIDAMAVAEPAIVSTAEIAQAAELVPKRTGEGGGLAAQMGETSSAAIVGTAPGGLKEQLGDGLSGAALDEQGGIPLDAPGASGGGSDLRDVIDARRSRRDTAETAEPNEVRPATRPRRETRELPDVPMPGDAVSDTGETPLAPSNLSDTALRSAARQTLPSVGKERRLEDGARQAANGKVYGRGQFAAGANDGTGDGMAGGESSLRRAARKNQSAAIGPGPAFALTAATAAALANTESYVPFVDE